MKKNNKKITIISILLIIVMCAIITAIVIKYTKVDDESAESPFSEEIESYRENLKYNGLVKYENQIDGVEVGDIALLDMSNQKYLNIALTNTTEEDKEDLVVNVDFVNTDGDIILQSSTVMRNLIAGTTDMAQIKITEDIATCLEAGDVVDHIVIR